RRGDADRAEKVFERAAQFGQTDEQTKTWLERSRVFKAMQAKAGSRAVAAEIARTAPLESPKADAGSNGHDFDEAETEVRMQPSVPPPPAAPAIVAPKERKYPMNAPTVEPFSSFGSPPAPAPSPKKSEPPPIP